MLDEMMLAFSRDSWLPRHCPLVLNTAPLLVSVQTSAGASSGPGLNEEHITMCVPPCQVVPFSKQVSSC